MQGDKCHFENWRNPCLSDFDDRPAPGVGVGGGDAGTVRTGVGSSGAGSCFKMEAAKWRRPLNRQCSTKHVSSRLSPLFAAWNICKYQFVPHSNIFDI